MGGDRAPVEIPASIEGMMSVVDGLTLEGSGQFIQYDGEVLPW